MLRKRLLLPLLGVTAVALYYLATRPVPIAVELATVAQGTVAARVSNTRAGTIKACRRATITPSVPGQVARLLVHKGDEVLAGDLLMELWNDDLQAALKLANSQALAAQAKVDEACLQADTAAREAQRQSTLFGRGMTPEETRDKARSTAAALAAACTAAKASGQVSQDSIAQAEAALERTRLRAPFDGVVAEINGEPGEYVTPSPPGIPTPPAVDLIQPGCLYLSAPIDEVDAPQVQHCMAAEVSLDAFGERRFAAQVRRIAPYVQDYEKQARTVEVEVQFTDPDETAELLPGYSADVEIITQQHDATLFIPAEALVEGKQVYLYDPASSTLSVREVTVGLRNWQRVEITAGLKAGDQVVSSVGRAGVEAGALVTPESP